MVRNLFLLLLAAALGLSGCSVGMARHGKKTPDLDAIEVGSTRSQVEWMLGAPVQSASTSEGGGRIDTYEYEVGNDPSADRAGDHLMMDIWTFGLWELIGTPIEALKGTKYRIHLEYGPDDKVVKILPPGKANKSNP